MHRSLLATAFALSIATSAAAQDEDARPTRWRVALGPQLVPGYPGDDGHVVRPFIDVSRARGDDPFAFEAADESGGFALLRRDGFAVGPAFNIEGRRRRADVGANVDEVGFTIEAGGFAQYQFTPALRVRVEARQGIGGHKGAVGNVGLDYIARDGDAWLFAIGPRLTLADGGYQRAYFGVTPDEAVRTALPAYRPGGGLVAAGVNAGYLRQLTPRFGVYGYAKYDRLVEDAAASPVVRAFGSRDQVSGGIALTYTFTRGG